MMRTPRRPYAPLLAAAMATWLALPAVAQAPAEVGRKVFFDTALSEPRGIACASCHDPRQGWAGNNGAQAGAVGVRGAIGARNTPTIGYVLYVPAFRVHRRDGPSGGLFWDGRANTLEEQARGPLFAPTEMNLADDADLARRLRAAPYAGELQAAFALPPSAGDKAWADAGIAALSAFQRSAEVSPFSSKYDEMLRGKAILDASEARGLKWFRDRRKGNCAACHVIDAKSKDPARHLFTDFTYDNLGLPRNAALPANADAAHVDLGLCGPARTRPRGVAAAKCGAFKVPTLRNVAKRPFLFHNGVFTTLEDAVRFYAERDTHPAKWYPAGAKGEPAVFNDLPSQYRANVKRDEAPYDRKPGKKPRLNDAEIADVVAFLKTLSDTDPPTR